MDFVALLQSIILYVGPEITSLYDTTYSLWNKHTLNKHDQQKEFLITCLKHELIRLIIIISNN